MEPNENNLFVIILALLLIVPSALLNGFVLSKLWGYFVVPLGVMQIGVAHAIGIAMIASFVRSRYRKPDSTDLPEKMALCIIEPLYIWGVAAIVHGFM